MYTYGYLKKMLENLKKSHQLDPELLKWMAVWDPQKLATPLPAELNSLVEVLYQGRGLKVTPLPDDHEGTRPRGGMKTLSLRPPGPVILLERYC